MLKNQESVRRDIQVRIVDAPLEGLQRGEDDRATFTLEEPGCRRGALQDGPLGGQRAAERHQPALRRDGILERADYRRVDPRVGGVDHLAERPAGDRRHVRSEEHTSELQSLMRTSYAVFCLKKTKI